MRGKIIWSATAKNSFDNLIEFLESKWEKKVIVKLFVELSDTLKAISQNPEMYPMVSTEKEIRKCIIRKKTLLIYRIKQEGTIELVVFADTRQNPKKYKI